VAVKILPEAFAQDPARLARFDREARALAALNHPGIAGIYGIEEADSGRFLVLELVEGETLAARLSHGPLPVEQALSVCRQIAEALEVAHEKGLIHRDLKPGNIMVTPDEKVKLLDFGLAKGIEGEPSDSDPESPTLPRPPTGEGVILGTAAYMSPEQARGKPLDKRTDIWSFGCVLYEALTGRRPFSGETVSDTITAVLSQEPDWDALPSATPGAIQTLLDRCLRKDRAKRLHDIGDARIELEEAFTRPSVPETAEARHGLFPTGVLVTILALVAAVSSGIALWKLLVPDGRVTQQMTTRLTVSSTEGVAISGFTPSIAISHDGSKLVYTMTLGDSTELRLRSMNGFEAEPIVGSQGGTGPFFSPQGDWVGFFSDGMLRKVPLTGAAPTALCAAANPRGATWTSAGTIIFASSTGTGLSVISANGDTPHDLTQLDVKLGERTHRWPQILPSTHTTMHRSKPSP